MRLSRQLDRIILKNQAQDMLLGRSWNPRAKSTIRQGPQLKKRAGA